MTEPIRVSDADTLPDSEPLSIKTVEAILTADRNRWFIATFILAGCILGMIMLIWHETNIAANNREVMYIKMYPNGSWENIHYQSTDPQLYFKTTVDSVLANYVEERFSVNPATIAQNYGEAQLFLSPSLAAQFVGKEGFNAAAKAADATSSPDDVTQVTWQWNDHYDNYNGNFDGKTVNVQRTNIYFTETHTVSGTLHKVPMMLTVNWALMPKNQLQKQSKTFLHYNPIGLQILSQKLTKQPLGALTQ